MFTQSARANIVPQIKVWTIPKEVKIVNEKRVVNCTDKTGATYLNAKGPAKTTDAPAR